MTQIKLHAIDLPTLVNHLHRQSIGFDRMFDDLTRAVGSGKQDNYPPHNLIKIDDTHFVIELAVAGFAENEVDIELKENSLTIRGEQLDKDDCEYLYKGISTRGFVRTFPLAEYVEVHSATIKNGILSIYLEQVIPEEVKPKKIAITFQK